MKKIKLLLELATKVGFASFRYSRTLSTLRYGSGKTYFLADALAQFARPAFMLVCLTLAACSGDAKENLGLNSGAPDEFAVERKPKLDVPPDFKLRPPTPGVDTGGLDVTRDLAKEKLTGIKLDNDYPGPDKSILNKFGTDKADPNIRSVLTKEYPQVEEKTTLEKLNAISDKNANKTLVDPAKEKERIEKNKAENKPVTNGETPAISENQNESILEKFFDIF